MTAAANRNMPRRLKRRRWALRQGKLILIERPSNAALLRGIVVGGSVGGAWFFVTNRRDGRRRRDDFIACGGDPTGMTDMMFGVMRGYRTGQGEWVVPAQGSGDYQG